MHRDIGVAMIRAPRWLGAQTYQTGAWPHIGEFSIEEFAMCGRSSVSPTEDRIAPGVVTAITLRRISFRAKSAGVRWPAQRRGRIGRLSATPMPDRTLQILR